MEKIQGGFVLISRNEVSHLKGLLTSRSIALQQARGRLGFLEMRAIRSAADSVRAKPKRGQSKLIPNYTSTELSRLTNLSLKVSARILRTVEADTFSEKGKLVPLPRRILRFLAKCEKRSTILVLLSYIERGLCLDRGRIKNAGTAKSTLLAYSTGLSLRSVKLARAELLSLGIITPDTTKYQRKLNRDGAYFTVNLSWKNPTEREKVFVVTKTKIAPLPTQNSTQIAPPIRDKITSYEFRNQKTQSTASSTTGVFSKRKEAGQGRVLSPKPCIKNVQREDLEQFSRCDELYRQACSQGIIKPSEASYLRWFGAAVRAKSIKAHEGEAVKVFIGIIKRGLWMNITQEQEERARAAIKKREGER